MRGELGWVWFKRREIVVVNGHLWKRGGRILIPDHEAFTGCRIENGFGPAGLRGGIRREGVGDFA